MGGHLFLRIRCHAGEVAGCAALKVWTVGRSEQVQGSDLSLYFFPPSPSSSLGQAVPHSDLWSEE